ncbi:hypothetical protein [Gluconobacter sp. P1C6_b]|uniref:hypothetical protein n=1 Tax=Gluconobacter sp. P1C6_b TaxID=2762619 RepID=UPI001C0470B0|nr:hypothetical protein [Gluconobacter sp. P1C6_b]
MEDRERLRLPLPDADAVAGRDEVLQQDVGLAAKILRATDLDLFGNPASLHDIASVTMHPSRIPAAALLRRSRLFQTVRNTDAQFWRKEFKTYMTERRTERRNHQHIMLRLTAVEHRTHPSGVHDVGDLREDGGRVYSALARALYDAEHRIRILHGIVLPLYIGTHDVFADGGWIVKRHYHVGVDINRAGLSVEDWQFVRERLERHFIDRGFTIYVPELDQYADEDAEWAAWYAAGKTKAEDGEPDELDPDALAEYHRQTVGSDFYNPRGDFRRFRADLNRSGQRSKFVGQGVELVAKGSRGPRTGDYQPHARALVNHRSDGFEVRTNVVIAHPDAVDLNPDALASCDLSEDIRRARYLADEGLAVVLRRQSADTRQALAEWLSGLGTSTSTPSYDISVNLPAIHPSAVSHLMETNTLRVAEALNTAAGYLPGVTRAVRNRPLTRTAVRHLMKDVIESARNTHRFLSSVRRIRGLGTPQDGENGGIPPEMVGDWQAQAARLLADTLNPPAPAKATRSARLTLTPRPPKPAPEPAPQAAPDDEDAAWRQAIEDQKAEYASRIAAQEAEKALEQAKAPHDGPAHLSTEHTSPEQSQGQQTQSRKVRPSRAELGLPSIRRNRAA